MSNINASLASTFARRVYGVNNDLAYEVFLNDHREVMENAKRFKATLGSRIINVQDNFAVCASGTGEWENHLFIIFRGSTKRNYGADWISNARIGVSISADGNPVHTGFNHIFSSMTRKLAEFINSAPQATTIHCIGHSLGGAVANLCAEWASGSFSKSVKLYTFGAPRVGNGPLFATKLETSLLTENMFRVYHSNDPVPMIPVFPFIHAPITGSGYYLPKGGGPFAFGNHSMSVYQQSVGGFDWNTMYQPAPGLSIDTIKSWLNSNSDENPNQATFWDKLNYAFSILVQKALILPSMVVSGAVTVADYLAILLLKGIELAGEVASWAFWIIKKMMRSLGEKAVETVEDVTRAIIESVLKRLLQKLENAVQQALKYLQ